MVSQRSGSVSLIRCRSEMARWFARQLIELIIKFRERPVVVDLADARGVQLFRFGRDLVVQAGDVVHGLNPVSQAVREA